MKRKGKKSQIRVQTTHKDRGVNYLQDLFRRLQSKCDEEGLDEKTEVRRHLKYLSVVSGVLENHVGKDEEFSQFLNDLTKVRKNFNRIKSKEHEEMLLPSVSNSVYELRGKMESYLDALDFYPKEKMKIRTVVWGADGGIEGQSKAVPKRILGSDSK